MSTEQNQLIVAVANEVVPYRCDAAESVLQS